MQYADYGLIIAILALLGGFVATGSLKNLKIYRQYKGGTWYLVRTNLYSVSSFWTNNPDKSDIIVTSEIYDGLYSIVVLQKTGCKFIRYASGDELNSLPLGTKSIWQSPNGINVYGKKFYDPTEYVGKIEKVYCSTKGGEVITQITEKEVLNLPQYVFEDLNNHGTSISGGGHYQNFSAGGYKLK